MTSTPNQPYGHPYGHDLCQLTSLLAAAYQRKSESEEEWKLAKKLQLGVETLPEAADKGTSLAVKIGAGAKYRDALREYLEQFVMYFTAVQGLSPRLLMLDYENAYLEYSKCLREYADLGSTVAMV